MYSMFRKNVNDISYVYLTVTITFVININATTLLTTTAKSKLETVAGIRNDRFVNLIKQDLRKNNDDYIETSNISTATGLAFTDTAITTHIMTNRTNAHSDMIGKSETRIKVKHSSNNNYISEDVHQKANRRIIENASEDKGSASETYRKAKGPDIKESYGDGKITANVDDITKNIYLEKSTEVDTPGTTAASPAYVHTTHTANTISGLLRMTMNKEKKERFKKFLNKNKGLLEEFIKTKRKNMKLKTSGGAVRARPSSSSSSEGGAGAVGGAPQLPGQLPNSEQLDMAPARGSAIHFKRIKGRLCQRSVLMPEGPKYDSKGAAYLPAYRGRAARPRDYPLTKPPRLVLPRCCNCCKKSALGCE